MISTGTKSTDETTRVSYFGLMMTLDEMLRDQLDVDIPSVQLGISTSSPTKQI